MSRNKYPEKTEQLIISVATKLFLEKGYENTSLNDIISNLGGLTKGAIYSHFKSKDEIYQAVIYQLSASSDNEIEAIIKATDFTGRQKIELVLKKSLESAISNHSAVVKIDYSKNPKLLYSLLEEIKNEVAPMFVLPIINQGIQDGSIQTDFPEQLAQILVLIINFWINPLVFECSTEEILKKCKLFSSMLAPFNLDIINNEILNQLSNLK